MSRRLLNHIVVSVICSACLTGSGTALAQTCPPGDPCDIGEWGDPVTNGSQGGPWSA